MDYNQILNLKEVINASGKMSILGVSTVSEKVLEAQRFGGTHFFEMSDLVEKSGYYLAHKLGAENASVVASASAAIAQSVAALIGQGSKKHLMNPYNLALTKRNIIMPKGHNVNFGSSVELMVQVGGGVLVEAGYANECTVDQVAMLIDENTAALLYIKSHHTVQKSMLSIEDCLKISQEYKIPLILDAAAEEDLQSYAQMGVDIVIYSGAKALEGPSSGLVVGKNPYIEWVQLQSKGLGRTMKIGKENILGLVAAINHYLEVGSESGASMKQRLEPFVRALNTINNISAKCVQDGAGREIYRASIHIGKLSAYDVIELLKKGDSAVYTREYQANNQILEFDIRAVDTAGMELIVNKLRTIMEEK